MRIKALLALSSLLAVVAVATVPASVVVPVDTASAAAVDYFLKIEGVEGESKDNNHKNEINIESFSWGVSQMGTHGAGGGGGAGKVSVHDISITKVIDKSSPILFQSVATGKHFPKAVLVGRKTDGHEFLVIELEDILISSFEQDGDRSNLPMDQVSINFAKIIVKYYPQGADGRTESPVVRGWDIKMNKPI
jgi:type VI secretion system secreted protein Hcp